MLVALAIITLLLATVVAYLFLRANQQTKTLKDLTAGFAALKSEIANMRASEAIIIPDVPPTAGRKRKTRAPKR